MKRNRFVCLQAEVASEELRGGMAIVATGDRDAFQLAHPCNRIPRSGASHRRTQALRKGRDLPLDPEVIDRLTSRFDEGEAIELNGPGPIPVT
jgi:hypothetical protein